MAASIRAFSEINADDNFYVTKIMKVIEKLSLTLIWVTKLDINRNVIFIKASGEAEIDEYKIKIVINSKTP